MYFDYQIMLIAWAVVAAWIAMVIVTNRKVHPKALFALFMVELWERFSYYGMRAFLVFYLTTSMLGDGAKPPGFGMDSDSGHAIYAAYGALVYLTPLLGGFLADRFLGFRKSITWGAILMAGGQLTLFGSLGDTTLLFLGLALLTIGNGFFKPNISSLVSKYYPPGDARRDGAFTIFYMGINLGAFLAPLTCAAIGQHEGWKWGFFAAFCGMMVGLSIFLWTVGSGLLVNYAEPPAHGRDAKVGGIRVEYLIYLGTLALLPLGALLLHHNKVMDYLLSAAGLGAICFIFWISLQYGKVERQRIWVIIILLIFTAIFWTFFELAGSSLNEFAEKNVNRKVTDNFTIKATSFQSANPFFIMLFAPVISALWIYMGKRKMILPAPYKFAIGLALLGLGFLALNIGRPFAVAGLIPAIFLIFLYLLHTLGELVLSPVGLSLVTKLAPPKIVGFMLGFWFLSSAVALQATGFLADMATIDDKNATVEQSLDNALGVYTNIGYVSIGAAVLLLFLSPQITRWMHGVETNTQTAKAEQEPPMNEQLES